MVHPASTFSTLSSRATTKRNRLRVYSESNEAKRLRRVKPSDCAELPHGLDGDGEGDGTPYGR
jgi:hypothetical protein